MFPFFINLFLIYRGNDRFLGFGGCGDGLLGLDDDVRAEDVTQLGVLGDDLVELLARQDRRLSLLLGHQFDQFAIHVFDGGGQCDGELAADVHLGRHALAHDAGHATNGETEARTVAARLAVHFGNVLFGSLFRGSC